MARSRTSIDEKRISLQGCWEVFHLQDVITYFSSSVINQLTAGHALTGCDTVVKVSTKAAMLKLLIQENEEQRVDFGRDRMVTCLQLQTSFLCK